MGTIKRVLRFVWIKVIALDVEEIQRDEMRRQLRKLHLRRGFRSCGSN